MPRSATAQANYLTYQAEYLQRPEVKARRRVRQNARHDANRDAINAKRRALVAANRERWRGYYREDNLKRNYGISLADYSSMLQSQGDVCAICERPEEGYLRGRLRTLAVDHDHVTGRVRGLLCTHCNRALGSARDDPAILLRAIRYLKENS